MGVLEIKSMSRGWMAASGARSISASTKETKRSVCSGRSARGAIGGRLGLCVGWGGNAPSCCWSSLRQTMEPIPCPGRKRCPRAQRSRRHRPELRRWSCILVDVWQHTHTHTHQVPSKRRRMGSTLPWQRKKWAPSPPRDLHLRRHTMQP